MSASKVSLWRLRNNEEPCRGIRHPEPQTEQEASLFEECARWFFANMLFNFILQLGGGRFSTPLPAGQFPSMEELERRTLCINLEAWQHADSTQDWSAIQRSCQEFCDWFSGCFNKLTPENQDKIRQKVETSIRTGGCYRNLPDGIMSVLNIHPA